MEPIMSMFAEFLPLLDPKFLMQILHLLCREFGSTALGRRLGGLVIRSMRLGGLFMLALRSIVTETARRIGRGSSETLAQRLGLIAIVCAVLYAVAPTSIPGAVLIAGWLGAVQEWHARSGAMLPACMLSGICIALLVWDGAWWRGRDLRLLPAARRRNCCIEN
jgi:hypothetical protein